VALLDLSQPGGPRLAEVRGEVPLYPASVIKLVYLMAAFRWQELGRITIDKPLQQQLKQMIHDSSNQATQRVFYQLTGTGPGPELRPADYQVFRDRRYSVKRWVQGLGVEGIHCIHPTYDGRAEIFGREAQFLRDQTIPDGGQGRSGYYYNRVMMTATGTAKLLALLATDRSMSPASCGTVREMMRRDIRQQPHLQYRIAGGASRLPGMEVFSKSGTALNIFADAGIVRHVSGRQMAIAVIVEGPEHGVYRGNFIADLTERCAARVLLDYPDLPRRSSGLLDLISLDALLNALN
jgi:beta-lactamase class A